MPPEGQEKTEAPTPRRRLEAREKGQVARSQDLSAAVPLLVATVMLALLGPGIVHTLLAVMRSALQAESPELLEHLLPFTTAALVEAGKVVAPFLAVVFVTLVCVLYAQVGPLMTFQSLTPDLNRLNPVNGFKRMLSMRSVMMTAINIAKLIVVGAVAYFTVAASATAVVYAHVLAFEDILPLVGGLAFDLAIRLAVALLILALLDLAWQRYKHEQDLKMTKEEVKDELRSMEGDPHIKRRRREVQQQIAMRRLRREVPKADVVVANPTHYAVAIRYQADTMAAPMVVAKGVDQMAIRIRQLAVEFGVPIVQRPPLARALHDAVEVGEYIPEKFYQAIAEILAYVYELTGKRMEVAAP